MTTFHDVEILSYDSKFGKFHVKRRSGVVFATIKGIPETEYDFENEDDLDVAIVSADPITNVVFWLDKGHRVKARLLYVKGRKGEHYEFYEITFLRSYKVAKMEYTLPEISTDPLSYIDLKLGLDYITVQADGFMLYTAPTGQGKTYFALDNMDRLCKVFDKVVILAYEITERDYLNRMNDMYGTRTAQELVARFGDKIIISFYQNIRQIRSVHNEGRICFIVDNVDNISLATDSDAFFQANWLREFDKFIKEEGHFGIVLSQLNNKADKAKYKDVTVDHVAGSKERVDLCRSAYFTWFDESTHKYEYKYLKLGTSKFKRLSNGEIIWKVALSSTYKGQR